MSNLTAWPLTLLTRRELAPRTPTAVLSAPTLRQVETLLPASKHGTLYAVDLETRGSDASLPDTEIIGIGFANEDDCFYLDLRAATTEALDYLRSFLCQVRLTSFNVLFDGAFLQKFTGCWLRWEGCSYGLYKYMANEGFNGQRWNLESAQLNVLGWSVSNKPAFDALLASKGLDKSTMWQLPPEEVGPYCASDADAHWQLWEVLIDECRKQDFPHLLKFHQREFMTEVELFAEQQFRGMDVDSEQVTRHSGDLALRTAQSMESFLSHPQGAHHIAGYNKDVRDAWSATQPPPLLKDGSVSKNWEKWRDREKVWMENRGFNVNSKQQLAWLLYEKVYKVAKETPKQVHVVVEGKVFEVDKTDGGARSVKKQILPLFGEVGNLLVIYNKLVKEAGYVRAAEALLKIRPTIHPEMNSVGTVTGRPASGQSDD